MAGNFGGPDGHGSCLVFDWGVFEMEGVISNILSIGQLVLMGMLFVISCAIGIELKRIIAALTRICGELRVLNAKGAYKWPTK